MKSSIFNNPKLTFIFIVGILNQEHSISIDSALYFKYQLTMNIHNLDDVVGHLDNHPNLIGFAMIFISQYLFVHFLWLVCNIKHFVLIGNWLDIISILNDPFEIKLLLSFIIELLHNEIARSCLSLSFRNSDSLSIHCTYYFELRLHRS